MVVHESGARGSADRGPSSVGKVLAEGHLSIEYRWVRSMQSGLDNDRRSPREPLIVFLHEGLGSVSMWRDFPDLVCAATGLDGLVYSRPGYGRSSARRPGLGWGRGFMHEEALEVLPALLRSLELPSGDRPLWLFGHSDGASIALIHAAHHPGAVAGLVALAPHIMVEEICLASIRDAVTAFSGRGLRERLARHHHDVDDTFHGWSGAWLDPAFADWSIEDELNQIDCPILAVQGLDDRYGTLDQIRGIARRAGRVRLLELPDCGHSPHRDQPERVLEAVAAFMSSARVCTGTHRQDL
jgi:pimeloyl-ACP methyl ester carboxylesterase